MAKVLWDMTVKSIFQSVSLTPDYPNACLDHTIHSHQYMSFVFLKVANESEGSGMKKSMMPTYDPTTPKNLH